MSVVILEDEIVHYEVLGRGRPIIFLHGWVGSWRYWITTMQAASFSYRAYALDLWGFGDTAKNSSKYALNEQCNLVGSFMDKMGLPRAVLIGHGLGALVAMQFAFHRPDLIDRVMAVSAPMDGSTVNPRLKASTPADLADWLLGRLPSMESARAEAPRADSQAIRVSLENLQILKLQELLIQLRTPCLIVQGQNDPILSASGNEDLSFLPESAHHILFETSGHFPMLDESSKFNRLLVDFLSLSSGESPRHLQLKDEWKRRVR
jgi:pimeloyl-ACP methyl ester carboxylesterase